MKRLLNAFVIVSSFNFVAFVSIALMIGGDALNGKAKDGRFFSRTTER